MSAVLGAAHRAVFDGGRSPAQAGSRCHRRTRGGVSFTVVVVRTRRMNAPQVVYFPSGVLV